MKNPLLTIETSVGAFPIKIIRRGRGPRNFIVTYGKQAKMALTWEEAAKEFGDCVFHSLECDGKIQRHIEEEEKI